MRFFLNLLLILLPLGVLIMCTGQTLKDQDLADLKTEIEKQWTLFIEDWENEEAGKLSQFYTQTGINIPPDGQRKNGRQEISDFYQDLFNDNLSSKYKHTIDSIYTEGDTLVEIGHFEVNWLRNDSTEWSFKARSKANWVNENELGWKIARFGFTMN